ncbi:MAG: NAD(P)H-dependent oxidoreductase [Bdellovibrionales bacterium]|nr:NAD(P)H-dependent oxidoreductase [Bdellovibrionales bacterium]
MAISLLGISGSARRESLNRKLLGAACKQIRSQGADVTELDMRDFELPLYDGDIEDNEGFPQKVLELKEIFKRHDGFIIASPEYNSSISPLLKNLIDWVSRPAQGEAALECFAGKTAALLSASPGGLGGLRGLVTVRSILGNIKVLVLPDQFALSSAGSAFDEKGNLKDSTHVQAVERVISALVNVTGALRASR